MNTRTIPFTPSQQRTIRTTGLLMLPSGLLLAVSGGSALSELVPLAARLSAWPVLLRTFHAAVELVLGLGLVIASAAFMRVASQGTVQALVGGLRALCVVFMIKAALLLGVLGVMLLAFLA